jgi:4'-phosphopantetheinyl transferase
MEPPAAGEVHVWRVPLTADAARIARLERILSAEERARVARFRFDRDRHRFIVGRAAYRDVLARYAGVSAAALPLTAVHGQKPLSPVVPCGHNLSHAHELGLIAIASDGDVGIDVEYVERPVDFAAVAPVALTPREHEAWRALPDGERGQAFFSLWTRKEAMLKAIGDRKAFEFSEVDAASAGRAWAIATFVPASGYYAAIALRSAEHRQATELLRLRLFDHHDDDGLRVGVHASGALQLADGAADFVQ